VRHYRPNSRRCIATSQTFACHNFHVMIHMGISPEIEHLPAKARELAEARNHKPLPFIRQGRSTGTPCVTCARQVYVMPGPGSPGP